MISQFNRCAYVFSIIVIFCLASSGYAQQQAIDAGSHKDFHKRREQIYEAVYQQLGLTPEQQKTIEAHQNRHKSEAKKIREALSLKKKELRKELQKPQLNMIDINLIHKELKDLYCRREDYRLKGILEVRGILTQEQFVQFEEKIHEIKSKFKSFHK